MADKYIKLTQLSHFLDKSKEVFVQKDGTKVLSDNNYTTAEKTKLAGIATGANNYKLPTATSTVLGGVKSGGNVVINAEGVMSVDLSAYQKTATADDKYYTKASATADLVTKVDKVTGKQLSTEDYTSAEKTKLAGVEAGANRYTLPVASATVSGGVKIGANLQMVDGVLNAVQGAVDLSPFETKTNASNTYVSKTSLSTTLTDYAKKSDIAKAVNYRGTVNAFTDLPAAGKNKTGDMYNVITAGGVDADGIPIKAGDNVVWNGTGWDNYGGSFVIDSATDGDIDGLFMTKGV
nr:MAG TPA: Head fiber protein [Caudoviricetes sp.]